MIQVMTKDHIEYNLEERPSGFFNMASNPKVVAFFFDPADKIINESIDAARRGKLAIVDANDPVTGVVSLGFGALKKPGDEETEGTPFVPVDVIPPIYPGTGYKVGFMDMKNCKIIKVTPKIIRVR